MVMIAMFEIVCDPVDCVITCDCQRPLPLIGAKNAMLADENVVPGGYAKVALHLMLESAVAARVSGCIALADGISPGRIGAGQRALARYG